MDTETFHENFSVDRKAKDVCANTKNASQPEPDVLTAGGAIYDAAQTYFFFDESTKEVRESTGLRRDKGHLSTFGLRVVEIGRLRVKRNDALSDGQTFFKSEIERLQNRVKEYELEKTPESRRLESVFDGKEIIENKADADTRRAYKSRHTQEKNMKEEELKAIETLGNTRYKFIESESVFKENVLECIHEISINSGWSEIVRLEQHYLIPTGKGKWGMIDFMLWHKNGTVTIMECKVKAISENNEFTAVGQLLLYASVLRRGFYYPRLVICAPELSQSLYFTIKEFNLPIQLLQIDSDKITYTS
jgi:hypothetical protein